MIVSLAALTLSAIALSVAVWDWVKLRPLRKQLRRNS